MRNFLNSVSYLGGLVVGLLFLSTLVITIFGIIGLLLFGDTNTIEDSLLEMETQFDEFN